MNARLVVAPRATYQAVLDVIKRAGLTQQRDKTLFPGRLDEGAQVFDGLDARVAGQHQLDGPGVVGIDQKRQLLCVAPAVKFNPCHFGLARQPGLQPGAVGGKAGVIHLGGLTATQGADMFFQQRIPVAGCSGLVLCLGRCAHHWQGQQGQKMSTVQHDQLLLQA